MTRVLIADDHPAFRRGVELMLDGLDDIVVVGHAETGQRAVAMAVDLIADVVLMDLRMPEHERHRGHPSTRPHRAHCPPWSSSPCSTTTIRCSPPCERGARGYLLKGADKEEIAPRDPAGGRGRRGHLRPRDRQHG